MEKETKKKKRVIIECIQCGRARPHNSFGLCNSCYITNRVKNNPKYKEINKKSSIKWRSNNKEYWKSYYKEHEEELKQYGRDYWRKKHPKKS